MIEIKVTLEDEDVAELRATREACEALAAADLRLHPFRAVRFAHAASLLHVLAVGVMTAEQIKKQKERGKVEGNGGSSAGVVAVKHVYGPDGRCTKDHGAGPCQAMRKRRARGQAAEPTLPEVK